MGKIETTIENATASGGVAIFMTPEPEKTRKPIPVTVVIYRVKQVDQKEIRRILGRDLVEAERSGKLR